MRVLIAEDEPISRMILQVAVESLGHTCVVAEDGAEAWDIYQREDVDVLISDRQMPGMDGVELCRAVRGRGRSGYTYFIFLTALTEKAEVLVGIEAGADDYLAKPLDLNDLQIRLTVAERVTALHRRIAEQQDEMERLNRQLYVQSRCDALTGLGNRLRLTEDLELIGGEAARYGHGFGAILFDVDEFKAYNDHYGHLAGDEVLRRVADALAQSTRDGDRVYRYGGEEFLLLLPEQGIDACVLVAERIRARVEALNLAHAVRRGQRVVTVSAGVATLNLHVHQTVYAWLREADAALYEAKHRGRNRVVRADEMTLNAREESPGLW
ncbi:MAG: hypothetical protein RLZZ387_514 [Chloroflexota bacterium]|jgi:diguanylate cyclase (GGDEF)-like protein